jgi:hypothetical protein
MVRHAISRYVVRITFELEGGPKGTIKVHAKAQVRDVGEKRRKSGNNCFIGWERKKLNVIRKVINYTNKQFGSPLFGLLERAEDVRTECLNASCRLSAGQSVDNGIVQFG